MTRPLVLLHGYSDNSDSYDIWIKRLKKQGMDPDLIHRCDYESLTNEITVKDLAEGFDRALMQIDGLRNGEAFDVIVHSTGMLVLRAWLTSYSKRGSRVKHLIGLAPASFGSPLAHKGRSWLGSIFKGRKEFGPDFLEAGDLVLDALELGSPFTWHLAHQDLLTSQPVYDESSNTPYVFIFCGTRKYRGLAKLISADGTDGTVRLAGCPLNTRKIVLDLRRDADLLTDDASSSRFSFGEWAELHMPLIPVPGHDHGSILSNPPDDLVRMVASALKVSSKETLDAWYKRDDVRDAIEYRREKLKPRQQFVMRAVDERGDLINDYNVQLFARDDSKKRRRVSFDMDVHVYHGDPSFRNFHVDLRKLKEESFTHLEIQLIASSGTQLVGYTGHLASEEVDDADGEWNALLDLTPLLSDQTVNFFHPFTTTLIELKLNREPLPLDLNRKTEIVQISGG